MASVAVLNTGGGFLSPPALSATLGGGSGATFTVTMRTPVGIRLADVSAVEVRGCALRVEGTGIEIASGHDIDVAGNTVTTRAGEPILFTGGSDVRIRGNAKRRTDGTPLAARPSAAGRVQAVDGDLRIDTAGGAATDTLAFLDGGTEGQVITLRSAASGRDPTVGETGNIRLSGSGSFTLSHPDDTLTLLCAGDRWLEVGRADNAA